jgi:LmbE family N-acetylglucosaminyl deacetylase
MFITGLLVSSVALLQAQMQPPIPGPDSRYKADILVVVAHPDDDTAASTYLSKAVLDEGKRVAVIFTTRGNSGPNAVGMEQSKALSDVREMEARRSLAARGITNIWFLRGQDTPTQDVLHSLETLGHGEALEEVVHIIRLTRPEVVLTWMPAYVAGENHGDHQASGVLAVEAFDVAGDTTVFPEQATPPRSHSGIANYGEGLRPWQAKKPYFVSDASHQDFLKGYGPTYLASDISSARKVSFAELNGLAWEHYATQIDFSKEVLTYFINLPEYFVLGKSLVPAPVEADVWTGIEEKPIPFASIDQHVEAHRTGTMFELGGPWAFYQEFYKRHGLKSLEDLVAPQSALRASNELWVPLLLHNDFQSAADFTVHPNLPAGWTGDTKDTVYHLEAGGAYPIQFFLTAPSGSNQSSPQTLSWTVTKEGVAAATASLSVYMEYNGVPQ